MGMGQCENRAWECHEHRDCDRMKKCKGKRCVCRGATCEISWKVPLNSGQGDVKHGEYYNNNDEDVNGDGEKAWKISLELCAAKRSFQMDNGHTKQILSIETKFCSYKKLLDMFVSCAIGSCSD